MILALMARFLEKLISPPEMKASCQERRDRVTFLVMHDCYADCGHLTECPCMRQTPIKGHLMDFHESWVVRPTHA